MSDKLQAKPSDETKGSKKMPRRASRRGSTNSKRRSPYKPAAGTTANDGREQDNSDTGRRFDNDFDWYNKNPYLTESVARVPFPNRPGMRFTTAYQLSNDGAISKSWGTTIPGILAIPWIPTFQDLGLPTDPNGLVAKEMYARVRKAFSGSLPEDAPDLVVYMYAITGIYTYISSLKRIYRSITAWNAQNYVVPDALLRALGVSNVSRVKLLANRTRLWGVINQLIDMTKRFNCPAIWDLVKRQKWMNETVFSDAATPNSQLYVFRQQAYFKWSMLNAGAEGVTAGGLTLVTPPWYNSDVSDPVQSMFDFGQTLLDAIADGDSDNYTISGHLARAFEDFPNMSLDYLMENEVLEIAYSEEVLSQIENCQTVGIKVSNGMSFTGLQVQQRPSNNAFVGFTSFTQPISNVANAVVSKLVPAPMVNSRYDRPDIADVVTSTRLKATITGVTANSTANTVTISFTGGTEVVLNYELYYLTASGAATYSSISDIVGFTSMDANTAWLIATLSQFDWHPLFRAVTESAGSTSDVVTYGDVHNITNLTIAELRDLHRVCILSELNAFGISSNN